MPKLITILASGTRGDVQPYLALGLGLRAAGYRVVVATHENFRALVRSRGLPFAPVQGNPNDLLVRDESALTLGGNWARSARATLKFLRDARPVFERMLNSAWEACRGAGALVVGLATTWGDHIAQALGAPCVWCLLQPLSRTRAFPSVFQPFTFSLGGAYNRLTHLALEQLMWQPWRTVINRWRRNTLGLPPLSFTGPFPEVYARHTPFVYGFSPHVAPRPADWPASHVVAGYWFLDRPPEWTPPAELLRFLDAGSPPVYIGFGSMGFRQPYDVITRALEAAGLRAVIALAAAAAGDISLPPYVLPVTDVPHEWLFPRVAAVAHHGGAGTTAAGLRAGVPAVVAPIAVDQFFWGERIAALGVGPRPVPQRALTAEKLAEALSRATQDEGMRSRAAALGRQIAAEDGVARAVEVIRSIAPP
jgi:sterol 3beta-glucosyltransferase